MNNPVRTWSEFEIRRGDVNLGERFVLEADYNLVVTENVAILNKAIDEAKDWIEALERNLKALKDQARRLAELKIENEKLKKENHIMRMLIDGAYS
jgi:DNA repair exonuclease SbcCD ATPase subunit